MTEHMILDVTCGDRTIWFQKDEPHTIYCDKRREEWEGDFGKTLRADGEKKHLHFGQIKYASAEIRINKDASPEMQMQTLFHEMVHGMLIMIGRNEEASDECFVQAFANALYQSFRLKEGES